MRVTDVDFVRAWVVSTSTEDVAAKTGLSVASVNVRATKLRKGGVNLPPFARKKKVVDAATLNAIIAGGKDEATNVS